MEKAVFRPDNLFESNAGGFNFCGFPSFSGGGLAVAGAVVADVFMSKFIFDDIFIPLIAE